MTKKSQYLEAAMAQLKTARTADELRIALAVFLPEKFGLSLAQTAAAIGRSVNRTSTLRNRFAPMTEQQPKRSKTELRNRALFSSDKEMAMLCEVLCQANKDKIFTVSKLMSIVEAKIGESIALSTLFNMLKRNGFHVGVPNINWPKVKAWGSVRSGKFKKVLPPPPPA
jgi:hypothetical protein